MDSRSNSPFPSDSRTGPDDILASNSHSRAHSHDAQYYSHSRSLSSSFTAVHPIGGGSGPPIAPLDFASIILSHDKTHASLAKTVSELSQWLAVVESGLSDLLDPDDEVATIHEEHEGFFDGYDSPRDLASSPITPSTILPSS